MSRKVLYRNTTTTTTSHNSTCHLCDVVVELLQRLLAVAEGVSGALAQLHQEAFVHREQLEARVEPLDMLAEDHLRRPSTLSAARVVRVGVRARAESHWLGCIELNR